MSEERICMELKFDKKFIDEAVQKAVKDIKQNYIPKDVLDKIRAEIAEYGSIMVAYAITKDTKTDKGIEKLVSDVLSEAKRQVLDIIDKYKEGK